MIHITTYGASVLYRYLAGSPAGMGLGPCQHFGSLPQCEPLEARIV